MNQKTEELYQACAEGDIEKVKNTLKRKPDINSHEWPSSFTPLHVCVSGQHDHEKRKEIVRILCGAGADPEKKESQYGLTPLQYTGIRNKPVLAEALLQCGANINTTESNGATALHGAAFHGNIDVAKVLLEHGAEPLLTDSYGNTPLSLANQNGHTELIGLFEIYS